MSETFSYDPASYHPGTSSSGGQSKTPPPLEMALSSDQYSPSVGDSAGSSPQVADPMSLSIPNPFLDSAASAPDRSIPNGQSLENLNISWRTDIEPAPVVSTEVPPHIHRPFPGRATVDAPSTSPENLMGGSSSLNRSNHQKLNNEDGDASGGNNRRQKRLERNRESARLSRRRRKQYLEVLESKVTELSDEMDQGRRRHVSQALSSIMAQRLKGITGPTVARTSAELRLAATFRSQQIQSLCTPPSTKFIFWLTLQNDVYFRGGRAASERLSAARIGERMLQNGNDKVTPAQSMWPLFCNEVALSYDQEERVRAFQKALLADKETWLERHTAYASSNTIKSTHEAVQAVAFRLGHRERVTDDILTPEQRAKLGSFVTAHRGPLKSRLPNVPEVKKEKHVAANLYVMNHTFSNVLKSVPRAPPLLTGKALKKLSRRPSFESLGVVSGERKDNDENELSRERSFASSGSLKRSASEMSIDGDERPGVHTVTPVEAEALVLPHVESILGHLKPIMPVPTPAAPAIMHQMPRTVPRSVASAPVLCHPGQQQAYSNTMVPAPILSVPAVQAPPVAASGAVVQEPSAKHQRKSSFLPAHLNVVPEEMWPSNDAVAEEFLMSLVEDDWAIGAHFD